MTKKYNRDNAADPKRKQLEAATKEKQAAARELTQAVIERVGDQGFLEEHSGSASNASESEEKDTRVEKNQRK